MKTKKIIIIFFAFISIFLLNSCGKDDDINYTEEKIPFTNLTPSYYKMNAEYLNTYYIDNSGVKYVDVNNFFKTLDGFYITSYFKKTVSKPRKMYFLHVTANTGSKIENLVISFNWNDDTITINNPLVFNLVHSPSAVDYMAHISEEDGGYDEYQPLFFNLKNYNFNIYYKDSKCFVPLSIMNTIFCSGSYYNIYYNGEKYLGTFYDISAFDDETIKTIKTNKLNSETQTEELREETYDQLRFVMDYYYGLKEYKNITDTIELFKDYKDDILSINPEKNRNAYYKLFINYLDDLHTRIGSYSFYNSPDILPGNWDLDKTSNARKKYKEIEDLLKDKAEICYPDLKSTYRTYNNTAILFMPNFVTASENQLASVDNYLYDSYEFMKWALNGIENQNIKNVVLDLSINGGGNVAALLKVLGFMSDEDIDYSDYNFLFKAKMTSKIKIDVNGDDLYSDNDAYTKYNWYILSGFNTFSAANSCVALGKSLGAKIIGQKSGGGMCSVMPIVLADSTTIEISSNLAQMVKFGDKYEFIEGGIEPDVLIDYENFYDISYIDNLLNN